MHAPTFVNKYDTTEELKDSGTYLLNCPWPAEELDERLPGKMKRDLANKHANFYIIDAAKLAAEIGLGKRTNSILQGAFFALTKVIPLDIAVADMKKNNYNSYFKKAGQKIVDLNNQAVDVGITAAVKVDIPAAWRTPSIPRRSSPKTPRRLSGKSCCRWIASREISCRFPSSRSTACWTAHGKTGTSAYSKRGVAVKVPKWNAEACFQCNRCAMCCPHAAIRPVLLSEAEKAEVPASFVTVPAKGLGKGAPDYSYRMQISPYDCLGCGVCLTACPANQNEKLPDALTMTPFEQMKPEQVNFDIVAMDDKYLKHDIISDKSVKTIQFGKAVFPVLGGVRGLRGDHIHQAAQPDGRRPAVRRKRGRLLVRYQRRRADSALLQGQPRLGTGVGAFVV